MQGKCTSCGIDFIRGNSGDCICRQGLILFEGNCLSTCPSGTYQIGDVCRECVSSCVECDALGRCTSCPAGYFFNSNGYCICSG